MTLATSASSSAPTATVDLYAALSAARSAAARATRDRCTGRRRPARAVNHRARRRISRSRRRDRAGVDTQGSTQGGLLLCRTPSSPWTTVNARTALIARSRLLERDSDAPHPARCGATVAVAERWATHEDAPTCARARARLHLRLAPTTRTASDPAASTAHPRRPRAASPAGASCRSWTRGALPLTWRRRASPRAAPRGISTRCAALRVTRRRRVHGTAVLRRRL